MTNDQYQSALYAIYECALSWVADDDGEGPAVDPQWQQALALAGEAPGLLAALKALTDWGREHTSPSDPNSPHDLLIAACSAIAKAEPEDIESWATETCESIRLLQQSHAALLAALREYVERHEAEGASPGLPEYDQACAAIAKAEGR